MVTWKVKIMPINIPNKIVSITAARTNDTPGSPQYAVSMASADISTSAKKQKVLDILWEKYQRKADKQSRIDTLIGNLETIVKTNLEGRE